MLSGSAASEPSAELEKELETVGVTAKGGTCGMIDLARATGTVLSGLLLAMLMVLLVVVLVTLVLMASVVVLVVLLSLLFALLYY